MQDPLAQELLSGEIADGSTVKIGAAQGRLTVNGKPVGGRGGGGRPRQADDRAVPEVVTRTTPLHFEGGGSGPTTNPVWLLTP